MILRKETIQKISLDPDIMSPNSHKRVVCKCDYCQKIYEPSMKNRTNSYKKFPKDSCKNCRYKKREEVSLNLHGVKNSSQRKDVILTDFDIHDHVEELRKMAQQGYSINKACEKLGIPKTSVIRKLKQEKIDISFSSKRSDVIKRAYEDSLGKNYKNKLAEKLIESSQKKFGVDNYFQSEEVKEKSKQTNLEKYGKKYWMQVEENKLTAKEKEIQSKIDSGQIRLYRGMTLSQTCESLDVSKSHFINLYHNVGVEEAFDFTKGETSIEKCVKKFLVDNGLTFQQNKFFQGKYPDFIVRDVAIECDGLYWHSDKFQKKNNYHYDKRIFYKSFNLKPLFFRSDEIEEKFPIVCSIITNALGMNQEKLFARKLEVKQIENKEAHDFCEKYHLMGGFKSGSKSVALFDGDRIVSVFQVKELKKETGKYDLSRYCTLPNFSVVGGFGKMLKFFERNFSPSSIQTFVDLRYGSGDYLEDLGFSEESCHASFNWTDGVQTLHRMKFRGNSGYEHGFFKIWDCGQRKMVRTY